MPEKKSFVVYHSYRECFKDFSDEEIGQLFRAMLEYSQKGEVPEMSKPLKVAFRFIRLQMDADEEKYTNECKRRSAAGAKGGAPMGNQNAKKNKQKQVEVVLEEMKQTEQPEDEDEKEGLPNGNPKEREKEKTAYKECKRDYGEFKKVMLSEEEYAKLVERMGKSSCEDYIAQLDGWLAEGNVKKNHYVTILNWWRRNENERRAKEKYFSKKCSEQGEGYGEGIYTDLDKLEV
jgi:hypothetical protein|nr:MAG TPA: hypothetical protein [Caudoviricetes sp.]